MRAPFFLLFVIFCQDCQITTSLILHGFRRIKPKFTEGENYSRAKHALQNPTITLSDVHAQAETGV